MSVCRDLHSIASGGRADSDADAAPVMGQRGVWLSVVHWNGLGLGRRVAAVLCLPEWVLVELCDAWRWGRDVTGRRGGEDAW